MRYCHKGHSALVNRPFWYTEHTVIIGDEWHLTYIGVKGMLGWHTQKKNDSKGALHCAISWRAQRDSQHFSQFKYCMVQIKSIFYQGLISNHEHLLYLTSSLVIMEIHSCPCILPSLQGIDKLFRDGLAEADVVAAAAPEPTVTA